MFKLLKVSSKSSARLTKLTTAHGIIHGPFFMPIATRGAFKAISTPDVASLGAEIILANTYHLLLSPGPKLLKRAGGLHRLMNWSGPILTDSGGFQVFSLAQHRKISTRGVDFRDPKNGNRYSLTPESVIQIQQAIGSDIMMVLDECVSYPTTQTYVAKSVELTSVWAKRCLQQHQRRKSKQLLFGIVQGGVYKKYRVESARQLTKLGFDGYAVGGVSVGEPRKKMIQVLDWIVPLLPKNKPRYVMGVGRPEEIVAAVKLGVDMFDCVIPTREARHGRLYVWTSAKPTTYNLQSKSFYKTINIANAKYAKDLTPINNHGLKVYSKAYLHHLFKSGEMMGQHLATLNNLDFYLRLMAEIRQAIKAGRL